jgi:plasmid stabilization system protein ParE
MGTVKWPPQAINDLEAIGEFYARDAPNYAKVLIGKLFKVIRRLDVFPRSGRVVYEI